MQPLLLALMFLIGTWPAPQPQSEFREFLSNEGKFSATMPGHVRTSVIVTNSRSEGRLLTHIVSANDNDLNEYLVGWTEYPQDSVEQRGTEKTFDRMRDALIKAKDGTLLSESTVNDEGYPARVVTFSFGSGRLVKVKFCFVKNRVYQVLAETRKEDSGAADKFFASFKLLPGMLV